MFIVFNSAYSFTTAGSTHNGVHVFDPNGVDRTIKHNPLALHLQFGVSVHLCGFADERCANALNPLARSQVEIAIDLKDTLAIVRAYLRMY